MTVQRLYDSRRTRRDGLAQIFFIGTFLGIAFGLSGCQQTVAMKVESEIPTALVDELPVSIGVYYSGAFRAHEYVESSEERGSWRIASGDSHVKAFNKILNGLFSEVRELPGPTDDSVDLVLVPTIERMQFSLPAETGFNYFEAWIEYIVELHDGDGTVLPAWRFTGYGQAPSERFGSIESGLSLSLGDALRNAGAQLATGLPSHAPIRERIPVTHL